MTDVAAAKKTARKKPTANRLPTRDEILKFIADQPGKAGKREIARAFGVTGADRIPLKRLLKELADEGLIEKSSGKRLRQPGDLPSVTVLDVVRRDNDGELIARPAKWEGADAPPEIVIVPDERKRRQAVVPAGVGDRILARLAQTSAHGPADYPYEARVIRRIGRGAETVLGIFRRSRDGGRVVPVDKRARNELVVGTADKGDAHDGDLVLAETLPGPRYGLKNARVRENFGKGDDQKSISLIAIHAHGIPDSFPDDVVAAAGRAKPARLGERTDLRDVPFVTIDPPDARDHDDAVWAAPDDDPKNPGGWVAMVAIADVAAYVAPGETLDREARKRGNSVYFPDRVVPMLPERISTDLCSLRENEDRPCLAVRMVFDKSGNRRGHKFVRGLMRSAARLSYGDVQAAIDGKPGEAAGPVLEPVLKPLWQAYTILAEARDKRGPLDLDLPEYKIELTKAGKVKTVRRAERFESMRLIEEFMIQANVSAAETLEQQRSPLIYRVHDAPSKEKLKALSDFLSTLGLKLARGQTIRPEHFNRILEHARESEHAQMISDVVLRSQSQAIYAPDNLGHFGLNLRRYAHFTSPIRRYADLIVHRALISSLKLGADGLTDDDVKALHETAEHISTTERRAMLAERDSTDRYIASYLANRIGATFDGRIAGVTRFGLFVKLSETGADGIVPIRRLDYDFFAHDESRHALIGERTGTTFRLGDPVVVRLEEAVPVTGGMRFEMVEGGTEEPTRRRKPTTRKKARAKPRGKKPAKSKGQKGARSGRKGRR